MSIEPGKPPARRIPTDAEKARNRRSVVMALGLLAFVVLVFVVTLVRMKGAGVAPTAHF